MNEGRTVFSPLARLAVALILAAATAGAAGQAQAQSNGPRRDVMTLGAPGQSAAPGTVNLEGFSHPIAPGALGPMPVQSTAVTVGGVNVGALSEFGTSAAARFTEPVAGNRNDPAVVGGFASYRVASEHDPRAGYGVSLRVGSDPSSNTDVWRVQPGVDYTTPLSPSWQLNSRLFSTYNLEGTSASSRSGFAGGEERGFRDVGLGFGVGYAPSERWTVQTQATYAVPLRGQDKSRSSDEGDTSNEFFGGVILNYKF
jgi:Outer membrane protein V